MADKQWKPPEAGEITSWWQDCLNDMIDVRRNYQLNTSYFHGDQWVGWNNALAVADVLDFGSQDEANTRTTVNKFKPRTLSLIARLLRTPLSFEPRPGGVDATAVRKARIERQILESKWHRDDWELTRRDELQFVILGGCSAVSVEPTWEYENPPVQDPQTGEWIKLPTRPGTKLTALAPGEFGIEPGSRSAREARWWIRLTTLTPKQARARYKLDYDPTPDSDTGISPMHRRLVSERMNGSNRTSACMVYTYYERPNGDCPGVIVHVVGGKVVEVSAWPFPFDDRLNMRVFVQTPMGGTWKGDTVCNDARQLQLNYNRAYTSINNHIGKADNARMLLPMGSVVEGEDDMTGNAGEIVRYDPQSGGEPHWMQAPNVPRWLREHISSLEQELDDLFSAHEVSRGMAPGDRNSGLALSILAEKGETTLGIMAGDQQRGWQDIAELVLRTERHLMEQASTQHGVDMEVTDILPRPHDEAPMEVRYRFEDISEHPHVYVPLDAVMPRSQVAAQDMMIRLAQTFPEMFASLGPSQVATVLQVPDPFAFAQVADPQVSLAAWENGRMLAGADDYEIELADWHDHDKHVQEHNRARASSAYRDADEAIRAYIDMHIEGHAMLAAQQMQASAQIMAPQVASPQGGEMGQPPMDAPIPVDPMQQGAFA